MKNPRTLISHISLNASDDDDVSNEVILRGWISRLRVLSKTTFIVLKDVSGTVQCVGATELLSGLALKVEDAVEIHGRMRREARSKQGFEINIAEVRVLNPASQTLPFVSSSDLSEISQEVVLDHRPLSLRTEKGAAIFKVQATILEGFRTFLASEFFTEIVTSKIVASSTEGGTNLFSIQYFDRIAYLAQSPQFFKEQGVCGLERVFETGHVYRAEPHATARHLTEYFSLDLEMGFIENPEELMELERRLLHFIFGRLNEKCEKELQAFHQFPLPPMLSIPIWEFSECLERLKAEFGRKDLVDDLDPQAERELCELANRECAVEAVFVVGFPLLGRPFYTHPRGMSGAAQSFDLLFRGLEITTGGQRLHLRSDLEASIRGRGMDPKAFEGHLRMFELGMPPHGGLAIGLERLTAQVLGISNVRQTTLYPRDRNRVSP